MGTLSHRPSETIAALPRYGVQQVAWKDIICVLEALGATQKRISGNHQEGLFEFPGGAIVKVPNPTRRQKDAHSWVFKQLLGQVKTRRRRTRDIFSASGAAPHFVEPPRPLCHALSGRLKRGLRRGCPGRENTGLCASPVNTGTANPEAQEVSLPTPEAPAEIPSYTLTEIHRYGRR